MSPQTTSHLTTRIFVFVLLSLSAIAIFRSNFVSGTSQSPDGVRELDVRMPGHVPIKVKIKKEKEQAFKDLKNEHWQRDFELEVKNTGTKPIYFLSLVILVHEVVMPDGNPYGVSLRYGRIEFVSAPGTVPTPDDVPIDPGETYVFKIPNYKVDGWEMWSAKEKIPPPKKVQVLLDYLSYGDDTGFDSPNGKPS